MFKELLKTIAREAALPLALAAVADFARRKLAAKPPEAITRA